MGRSTFGAKVNRESARAQSQAKLELSRRFRKEYHDLREQWKRDLPYDPDNPTYAYRNSSREAYQATIQQHAMRHLTYRHPKLYRRLYQENKIANLKAEGLYDEWVSRTNADDARTSNLRKRSKAVTT